MRVFASEVVIVRKVSNLLGLAVLATVLTKPMHPYEMASVMRARGKDRDMRIQWGSLYRVVQNLAKHGFIEAVQSERRGGRPERTVYRITSAGQAELMDWTRELVGAREPELTRFKAGLSVLGVLSPDDVVSLLGNRVDALVDQIASIRSSLDEDVPRLFQLESEYELAVLTAEVDWVRGLVAEITSGSLPGLADWRAFHRTGEVPPEYVELAERGTDKD